MVAMIVFCLIHSLLRHLSLGCPLGAVFGYSLFMSGCLQDVCCGAVVELSYMF